MNCFTPLDEISGNSKPLAKASGNSKVHGMEAIELPPLLSGGENVAGI
ncbi:MAG: hypothetical protein WBP41_19765 [Saprospiraceae bacterium]